MLLIKQRHEITWFLQIRKQRCRSVNRAADQRLCIRYMDSAIPFLFKSEVSSLYPSSAAVQLGLCRTWSDSLKAGFLAARPNYAHALKYVLPG